MCRPPCFQAQPVAPAHTGPAQASPPPSEAATPAQARLLWQHLRELCLQPPNPLAEDPRHSHRPGPQDLPLPSPRPQKAPGLAQSSFSHPPSSVWPRQAAQREVTPRFLMALLSSFTTSTPSTPLALNRFVQVIRMPCRGERTAEAGPRQGGLRDPSPGDAAQGQGQAEARQTQRLAPDHTGDRTRCPTSWSSIRDGFLCAAVGQRAALRYCPAACNPTWTSSAQPDLI